MRRQIVRSVFFASLVAFAAFAHPARAASGLADGPGRVAVEASCVQCHDLDRVRTASHTLEEWRQTLAMMLAAGSPLPRDQLAGVTEYLAKNYPATGRPAAVAISGPVKATIAEWVVPTPGSRPHDPAAAPDGTIWYAGQFANLLGRYDPRTGKFTEFHLKTAESGPHGLVFDAAGNVWFTANFKGYIGKLDARTGDIREYPMPDPAVRDPHTLIFDRKGILWFTAQNANVVGRLDPTTGAIRLIRVPTPRARPYGMVADSKGTPYFVEFGSNKIASIDPDTLAIHEHVLPHAESRPRRIAIGPDDVLWYTDYSRGYLGRYDPATGNAAEWPSPSGAQSQPYGIAFADGAVWYNESATEPNTMVRFDPLQKTFQTWAIPSGGGVVRNIDVTKDGNLALACSGVNRIGLMTIGSR
jgi:virginiamycin B lyase